MTVSKTDLDTTRARHHTCCRAGIVMLLSVFVVPLVMPSTVNDARAQKSIVLNPHGDLELPVDCSACHTPEKFSPAKRKLDFDHNRQTDFPLLGRHDAVACVTCHLDLRFDAPEIAPGECASCHVDVHQGSIQSTCATCHNTTSFQDVDGLSVHTQTSFPLTGAHEQIVCESCHVDDTGGAFSTLDATCESCHVDDYASAVTVDHAGLGFPTTCEQCHSTVMWSSGDLFDHAVASGGFDLVGAHEVAQCSSCHITPGLETRFAPAGPDDCYSCHAPDYESQHSGSGFPLTCTTCHGTDDWDATEGSFDHAVASGGFELVGAHEVASCSSCHNPADFTPLFAASGQDDCYSCHAPDYEQEHQGSGFPTTCTTCHGTDSWDASGSFDHSAASGGFDLVGAHTVAACESCHATPGFEPLFQAAGDDDCYSCHAPDYDQEHQGTGFPTTCDTCHGTDTWTGASFENHDSDSFPIYSGAHKGEWSTCQTCHTNPGDFQVFTCLTCHEHRQSAMDDKHKEENGYAYDSILCYSCHPRGKH